MLDLSKFKEALDIIEWNTTRENYMQQYQKAADILGVQINLQNPGIKKLRLSARSKMFGDIKSKLEESAVTQASLLLAKEGGLVVGSEISVSHGRVMRVTKITEDKVEWEEQFSGYCLQSFPRLWSLFPVFKKFFAEQLVAPEA